jgi:hypothetical protein
LAAKYIFFLLGLKHAKILANNRIIDPKSKKKKKIRFTFDNQVNLNKTINKKDHFCIVDSTSTTTIIYLFINISISFLYREHKIRSKTQKRELKICINERPHKNLSTERKNYLKGMAWHCARKHSWTRTTTAKNKKRDNTNTSNSLVCH